MKDPQILQQLIVDLCLRRTKEMRLVKLNLPPKTEEVHRIQFSEVERHSYSILL
jgi:SWI/SNF-related matrix-associated actin-dependent regulator of chromatin subfamily A3